MTERPTWTILLATGNPELTYTETVHDLYALRRFEEYYADRDYLVFPPEDQD